MKKHILLLNIAVIIPYLLLVAMGVGAVEPLWLLMLVISILNFCRANSKRELLIYNLILFAASSAGILAGYYIDKSYGVGWHPEKGAEIRLLMNLHIGYMLILTGIELLLMWIEVKVKKKVRIEKVFSDGECVYVKPTSGVYDKIYRAAMGVYWDENLSSLYFRNKEISDNEAVSIICEAVKKEYGVVLCTDANEEEEQ